VKNYRVHPTYRLISTQATAAPALGARLAPAGRIVGVCVEINQ